MNDFQRRTVEQIRKLDPDWRVDMCREILSDAASAPGLRAVAHEIIVESLKYLRELKREREK